MTDRQIASRPLEPEGSASVDRFRALGLTRNPFVANGPLISTPGHQQALDQLAAWIDGVSDDPARTDRLAVVTGEAGMGKSRVLRELAGRVVAPAAAPLIDPGKGGITDAQLLRAMVDALGGTATGRTGMELRRDVRAALADLPKGTVPGLFIDDADFTGSRLELIRNVLRDGADFGIWIVLAGQPDLADRVARRRSLKAILGPVAHIHPVEPADLQIILTRRVEAAMAQHTRPFFSPDTLEAIVSAAAGNPGRLLRIAELALGIALRQGADTVSRPAVLAAIHQVDDAVETPVDPGGPAGAIQVEMPLLSDRAGATRIGTEQRSLWDGGTES